MKERVLRLEELLLRELGQVIRREFESLPQEFISVTHVSLTNDLTEATVFVSVYPEENQEETLKRLNRARGPLSSLLAKRMKSYNLPKLHFKYDPSIAKEARIQALIEKTKER